VLARLDFDMDIDPGLEATRNREPVALNRMEEEVIKVGEGNSKLPLPDLASRESPKRRKQGYMRRPNGEHPILEEEKYEIGKALAQGLLPCVPNPLCPQGSR
jgi:hypothetical protein